LASVEARLDEVAADAAAARHLAAARDRDIADLGVKVEANRAAINALGEQTRARFDLIDQRFEQIDRNFLEVRGKLDQTAAGQERIIALLDQLIEHGDSGE
jgi:hypothetical protein